MFILTRKKIYKLLAMTGCIDYFWKKLPNGVYAFNYHRIGDKKSTSFDHAIFSCTTIALEQQIIAIKDNFTVINTQKLAELIENGQVNSARYALITFDDGYIDNYIEAYPILKKHQVSGIFYLATDFINSNHIPWWDEIAYILRKSLGQNYQVPKSTNIYQLEYNNIDITIQKIMSLIKGHTKQSTLEILNDIRQKFPIARALLLTKNEQLFINWQQAKEMLSNGMEIGSHTNSHSILSQLNDDQQQVEILTSKQILEDRLNYKINSIAYPVGRYNCYNGKSLKYVEHAGYKIAFNNEPGHHCFIENQFDINRYSIVSNNLNNLKFDCCFK